MGTGTPVFDDGGVFLAWQRFTANGKLAFQTELDYLEMHSRAECGN